MVLHCAYEGCLDIRRPFPELFGFFFFFSSELTHMCVSFVHMRLVIGCTP